MMDAAIMETWPPPAFAAAAAHRLTWAGWVERQARASQRPGQSARATVFRAPLFDERERARLDFLRWLYERDQLIA